MNKQNLCTNFLTALMLTLLAVISQAQATELDENCVINILNRTIQVSNKGGWSLPNVPSNMGQIRARATCTLADGRTVLGQSNYFSATSGSTVDVGDIEFDNIEKTPSSLKFSTTDTLILSQINDTVQLKVTAFYSNGLVKNVTQSEHGTNYGSTNSFIATVNAEGIVTALNNGVVLISARKDGVLISRRLQVSIGGDLDNDGIPDDVERQLGLNPNDAIDALEDQDNDGLSALFEYQNGTNIFNADTDGDGIKDKEELELGLNGFITSPLLADSDGDGINDNLEILGGSNPNDANSGKLSDYLSAIEVLPANLDLTYNSIDGETSNQLSVTGFMIDGSSIDLTSQSVGTRYAIANSSVASFGVSDGRIFAGQTGSTQVTVTNGDKQFVVDVKITEFDPIALSSINIPGFANNVDVAGDFAYVAAGDSGLQVVDVTNKSEPKIIGAVDTPGTAIDVKVFGNIVYLADGLSGLQIIDVSNPSSPIIKSTINTLGNVQDIAFKDEFVLVANGDLGFEIINVANGADPFIVASVGQISGLETIGVEGNNLIVGGGSTLALFDIEDITNPMLLMEVNVNEIKSISILNNYVYVVATNKYFVYKITNNGEIEFITDNGGTNFSFGSDVVATEGGVIFSQGRLSDEILFVDSRTPEEPLVKGSMLLSETGNFYTTGLAVNSSYVFMTEENNVPLEPGTSGDTSLYIGQYRQLIDSGGVSPTVSLLSPLASDFIVERSQFTIVAQAVDDLAIDKVEFFINNVKIGEDSSLPYEMPYFVVAGVKQLSIQVEASDLGGNKAKSALFIVDVEADSDLDSLADSEEINTWLTDPNNADTDYDGLRDDNELARGTDPLKADTDGDGHFDGTEIANGTDPLNPDITSPTVISSDPTNGESLVYRNAFISINFSESINNNSITNVSLTLWQDGVSPVDGEIELSQDGRQLLFTPTDLLIANSDYTVKVNSVKDFAGNQLAEEHDFTFEAGTTVYSEPFHIVERSPSYDQEEVPVNASITFEFNHRVSPASVVNDTFRIYMRNAGFKVDEYREEINGTFELSNNGKVVTFIPNKPLFPGKEYYMYVDGFEDDYGQNVTKKSYNQSIGSYFTTSWKEDVTAPVIELVTIIDEQEEVPLNARFNIIFNEAVNAYSLKNIKILDDVGEEFSVIRSVGDANILTIKPKFNLSPNSNYSLLIQEVADFSGNTLTQAQMISFSTSGAIDLDNGIFVSSNIQNNDSNVPTNIIPSVTFSEKIDPTSFFNKYKTWGDDSSHYIYDFKYGRKIDINLRLADDNHTLMFIPKTPLEAEQQYLVKYNRGWNLYSGLFLTDLAGNPVGATTGSSEQSIEFKTGSSEDNTKPIVFLSSIENNSTVVPLNAQIRLRFNEHINIATLTEESIQLMIAGIVVQGTFQLAPNRTDIIFIPSGDLVAGGNYTLLLNGVEDITGNSLDYYELNFSTAISGFIDNSPLDVSSILPVDESINVAVNAKVVLTFNDDIDPLSAAELKVFTDNGEISGDYIIDGNIVTFSPSTSYPGDTRISIDFSDMTDVAGNSPLVGTSSFITEPVFDTTSPTIISITPSDGALDIARNPPIIITFSESLKSDTINSDNFKLYLDGYIYSPTVYRSLDAKTVTLHFWSLPVATTVAVIITKDVTDLSGNPINDFVSLFTTVGETVSGRGTAELIYPTWLSRANEEAASDSYVYISLSKEITADTAATGLHVIDNGELVTGSYNLDSTGHYLEFIPDAPFTEGGYLEVYWDSLAKDIYGQNFHANKWTFQLEIKEEPSPIFFVPNDDATAVQLNTLIEIGYDKLLDPASVHSSSVVLRDAYAEIISAEVTLISDGQVISVKPFELLTPDSYYYVSISNEVKDLEGKRQQGSRSYSFTTAVDAVDDIQRPTVMAMSPNNGMDNVLLNPRYYAKFDEPIHPGTFLPLANMDVLFLSDFTEISYKRFTPLDKSTEYTEVVSDVTDFSGNIVVPYSVDFKTSEIYDFSAPYLENISPARGEIVSVNSSITFEMSQPMDPIAFKHSKLLVLDVIDNLNRWSAPEIEGEVFLADDGKTITWIPLNNLPANNPFRIYLEGMEGLNGVKAIDSPTPFPIEYRNDARYQYYFRTNSEVDVSSPIFQKATVFEGMSDVPTNARIRIVFDEIINSASLTGITLESSSGSHPLRYNLDSTKTAVTLTPITLLPANALVNLKINGVKDKAGNVQDTELNIEFSTGASVELRSGSITELSPDPTDLMITADSNIFINYNVRIDLSWINETHFKLLDRTENKYISSNFTLSSDGKRITITPLELLIDGHSYRVEMPYKLSGLTGNNIPYKSFYFRVTPRDFKVVEFNIESEMPLEPRSLFVEFNREIDAACVNDSTVILSQNGVSIAGNTWRSGKYRAYFKPHEPLELDANYDFKIEGVCDLLGNPITQHIGTFKAVADAGCEEWEYEGEDGECYGGG